jgi:hypothetical protein
MLREIEARHAVAAWSALKQAGRDGTSYDDLKKRGVPLLDDMQTVRPVVLRAVREHREHKKAAAEAEAGGGEE